MRPVRSEAGMKAAVAGEKRATTARTRTTRATPMTMATLLVQNPWVRPVKYSEYSSRGSITVKKHVSVHYSKEAEAFVANATTTS